MRRAIRWATRGVISPPLVIPRFTSRCLRDLRLLAATTTTERCPSGQDIGWYEGNYGSYIEDLKKRKGADADQPHRVSFKKLVRA
jgi:hypothetical protein